MTAGGLLITLTALVIISFFRGWIHPKSAVDFLQKRIETQDGIISTQAGHISTLTATNSVQAQTIDKQTAVGDTVVKVMSSVQAARAEQESA
jgi:hypothetical protein